MKLPFIFIIDYYNLCLGDDTFLINEINLISLLQQDTLFSLDFTSAPHFIRPDFDLFLNFLKSKFKNAEIFVYIPDFIYHHKIILDNSHITQPYLHTMYNYYDTIISTLILKYPLLQQNKNRKYVFDNQLIIFSNNDNNNDNISDKMIKCSNYNYQYYSNIYDKFINTYKINVDLLHNNPQILSFFLTNDIPIYSPNGTILQQDKLYQNSLKLYQSKCNEIYNNNNNSDTLFQELMKIIETHKYKINIPEINKLLI
jgi:hypothetical protein